MTTETDPRASVPRSSPDSSLTRPARSLLLLGAAVGLLVGVSVGVLTLRLNPHVHELLHDTALLLAYFAVAGLVLGAAGATMAGLLLWGLARVRPGAERWLQPVLVSLIALLPVGWLLALPDLALVPDVLGWAIFSGRTLRIAALAVGVVIATTLIGLALQAVYRRLARRFWSPARAPSASIALSLLALLAAAVLVVQALAVRPRLAEAEVLEQLPPPSREASGPVVLLCIDGLDEQVLGPLLAAGELPTFARLVEDGSHGELATYSPTLSPAIWTTMVTGKSPAEHGIVGFSVFALPGLERSVFAYPMRTGLNFRLPPLLERLPGFEHYRRPFTSDMRRTPALWEIAGRYGPAGVYRWRVSWPAEEIDGFVLPSDVSLGEGPASFGGRDTSALDSFPPALWRGLPSRRTVDEAELRRYWRDGVEVDSGDPRVERVRRALQSSDVARILALYDRFRPRFLAAAFPPVDAFHHLFGVDRRDGGVFAPAIDEHYRWVDARLGELLEGLPEEANVLVVSDHGYDFEANHHALAPPGMIFAHGPAFEAGRRMHDLSVFDVAPLVLRLLDLPIGEDMPASDDRRYEGALSRRFREARPERRIPSWGSRADASWQPTESPDRDRILEELEALGYIE